jgi:ketosteroid isomerase-like protein
MNQVEIISQYFKLLETGKYQELLELFKEEVVWHQPGKGSLSGVYKGRQEVARLFGEFMSRSKGTFCIAEVAEIMENGTHIAASLRFEASSERGTLNMWGVDLFRIENNKISEVLLFSSDSDAEDAFWG